MDLGNTEKPGDRGKKNNKEKNLNPLDWRRGWEVKDCLISEIQVI